MSPDHPISWTDPARRAAFERWLLALAPAHGLDAASLRPASADARFRRYFRATGPQGSFIVMDAPPDKEDVGPYLKVAGMLQVPFERLLDALRRPFEAAGSQSPYAEPAPAAVTACYQTFCGT